MFVPFCSKWSAHFWFLRTAASSKELKRRMTSYIHNLIMVGWSFTSHWVINPQNHSMYIKRVISCHLFSTLLIQFKLVYGLFWQSNIYIVDILWGGNLSMMFYLSSHECYKSFEVTSRRRVTLKTCSMNDLTSKTSYWDCRSHRICIVEKYNQAIITGQKTRQMNALSMQSGEYWLKVASIGSKWRVLGFTRHFS